MTTGWDANDETKLAEVIISVLPAGSVVRFCSGETESLRYAVSIPEMKLRSIVFGRSSLRRLLADTARATKLEYLQRDLIRSAMRRTEFHYPRVSRILETLRTAREKRLVAAAR